MITWTLWNNLNKKLMKTRYHITDWPKTNNFEKAPRNDISKFLIQNYKIIIITKLIMGNSFGTK